MSFPPGRIDPVSRRLADLFPEPNQPGNALGQNNYVRSAGSTINTDKWDARVDHTFGENTRMFGRYSQQKDVRVVPGPLPLPSAAAVTPQIRTIRRWPTSLTSSARPGSPPRSSPSAARWLHSSVLSRGFDFASLGFPANINAIAVDQVPSATITDIPAGISNGSDSFTQYQPRNVWAMRGGIVNSRGAHNLKFGIDYRILDFNEGQNTAPSGNYTFTRAYTQGPIANVASAIGGHGFADFLLGTPASGTFRQLNPISTQGLYTALYFQDDWRVSQKLTLNLGIRWDLQRGDREKWGRIAWFDPDCRQPDRTGRRPAESSRRSAMGERRQRPEPAGDAADRFRSAVGLGVSHHRQDRRPQRLWSVLCSSEYPGQRSRRDHSVPRHADGDQPRQQHHSAEPPVESVPARRAAAAERSRSGREHRRADSGAVL